MKTPLDRDYYPSPRLTIVRPRIPHAVRTLSEVVLLFWKGRAKIAAFGIYGKGISIGGPNWKSHAPVKNPARSGAIGMTSRPRGALS